MSRIEKALKKAIEQQDLVRGPGQEGVAQHVSAPPSEEARSQASVTGIGLMSEAVPRLSLPARSALKIIAPELDEAPAVKVFRELRTKIAQQVAPDAVIMVTGIVKSSGSSFVSTNLATAIAFDSARTALLVDCNLRNPSLYQLLKDTSARGLTDYLADEHAEVADIIHATGIERLRLIPAGRRFDERAEYFTMDKTRRLLDGLAARYPDRQIILDTPPITVSADAQILASLCDHVLVVVPYAGATESRLQAVLKSIDPAKLLGVVLNDEPALPPDPSRFGLRKMLAAFWNSRSKATSIPADRTRE